MFANNLTTMKQILTFLILSTATAISGPKVEIADIMHVKVDGVDKGTVVDAIASVPDARTAVLDWLIAQEKKRNDEQTAKLAALDKAKAALDTKANAALTALRAKKAKEEASGKGKRWEALDELEGELNVTAKDIRKAEIQARIDAAKKELEEASK